MKKIFFIDTEVSEIDGTVCDYGALDGSGTGIHTHQAAKFHEFISDADFICGHNIVEHDSKYINVPGGAMMIDTLYLSPLLFPNKPYHHLVKDDKLQTMALNNPLNDSINAMKLFCDEINAFEKLDEEMKSIYYLLLKDSPYFSGFFSYIGYSSDRDPEKEILSKFIGKICRNAPVDEFIESSPVALAYALATISATKKFSLIPRWVAVNYPEIHNIMRTLRNTPCDGCAYCHDNLVPKKYLIRYFNYYSFREYDGEPLQEKAVNAAALHKSLLAIFPTGGGKSLTFQLPALMAAEREKALTVVISPLQSLMKDQVDTLRKKGISEAVTINGLLNPLERAEAIEAVESGTASILYISPESLRSATIERLFMTRHIARFVIDEAHCFSAWGQDFRVDYLYIGDFIRELQEKKGDGCKIPVSCFTATAKPKVIDDIMEYFREKLGTELELFTTDSTRKNLRYEVLYRENDEKKYETLRTLIEAKNCPTIVYVSRTKTTKKLAEKLNADGFSATSFNGKMDSSEKQEHQDAFLNDEVQIIVATSAFGMGIDKPNVRLVVHYDISDSLENYIQEAGRAGRDSSQADCYVLFNDDDLDKHFILLNQTKLSISEINQVWRAIKELTKFRKEISCSPLEIARLAGWDDDVHEIETRVKTAVQALENAGFVRRGKNVPRIYATSILVKDMTEAEERIEHSSRIATDDEKETAKRIIKMLISSRSISIAKNQDAESRVDYIADRLGVEKSAVIDSIQKMREDGIIADTKDLTAYIYKGDTDKKSENIFTRFRRIEDFLIRYISENTLYLNYKEINNAAISAGIKNSSVNMIKTILYYWTISRHVKKELNEQTKKITLVPSFGAEEFRMKREKSHAVSEFIIKYLFGRGGNVEKEEIHVAFSVLEIMNAYNSANGEKISEKEAEEALLFLSKINALRLEGGFFVIYGGMRIERLIESNRIRYTKEHYRQLAEFYLQKIQQIHIVGEFATMMVEDYDRALQFVNDYFQIDYNSFLAKYFKGRLAQIRLNITPKKYETIFGGLSQSQLDIINAPSTKDDSPNHIVVSAGPGSGKTRVLVHKLASLLLLEDVKHEQLLMLTFSRAAAIEFKQRLIELIGSAAHFVDIKTFHSYCFDLTDKIGNLNDSEKIVRDAIEFINSNEVDPNRITKTVIVIDEAQDMDEDEFSIVEALMKKNEEMQVIAVGDDDQNIYGFRDADSKYLRLLISKYNASHYSLTDNYRSCRSVVSFANRFARDIHERMKTDDITAISQDEGEVKLIKHTGEGIETAVVEDLKRTAGEGTTGILTNTNEEALIVLSVLNREGIPARLIQSNDKTNLLDIAEVRFFMKKIDAENGKGEIDGDTWNNAIEQLKTAYSRSEFMPLLCNMLDTFEETNDRKFYSDLIVFLQEVAPEDFYNSEKGKIFISTIHKSKGREFDNVYIMMNTVQLDKEEEKRKIYVGITRAKKLLHIHYCGNQLDRYADSASSFETDSNYYPKPKEIMFRLSYTDVNLGFFKDEERQNLIKRFFCGLTLEPASLGADRKERLRFRETDVLEVSAKEHEKIQKIIAKGYRMCGAKAHLICAWKGKEDTEESVIILPDIYFTSD